MSVETASTRPAPGGHPRSNGAPTAPERPCIVITYPYPLGGISGGSRMTREIALHLVAQGAHVIVLPLSTNSLDRRYPRTPPKQEHLGFEFDEALRVGGVELRRVAQNPLYIQLDGWSIRAALKEILRERRVDAVLSYYHEGAFLPSFCRARGIRFGYISTWQTYEPPEPRGGPIARRVRRVSFRVMNRKLVTEPYQRAGLYFATSLHTRGQIVERFGLDPKDVVICPLGVDPGFFDVPIQEPRPITELVFFGRVVRLKGFFDAIEALGKLRAKGIEDWVYRIHGEGRTEWAEAAAEKHGIADKIEICGPADDEALKAALGKAQLSIMPSHAEAFGLSFAESQAAGVPVVAYTAGSVPEVVENGVTGWLAPTGDVDGLARLIEERLADPDGTHRAGVLGRERVRANFTWDRTASILLRGLGLSERAAAALGREPDPAREGSNA